MLHVQAWTYTYCTCDVRVCPCVHGCTCVCACVRACLLMETWMVFQIVRACAWHLAWHVRVTLPVVQVHAHINARMRICASCACPNDVAVTAS